ncbi:MAG: hypothetical protein WCL49_05340 [bacterium]
MIESCIVVALVCLLFFCIFQLSQLFAAQEVLNYAAGRGARARTVGFNHFMVEKTIRVGAIPNAGRLINPVHTGGPSGQYAIESARIPLYLGGESEGMLKAILDYSAWDTIIFGASSSLGDGTLQQNIEQEVSLTNNPFHRAFYASDSITLKGDCTLDEHYSLYLDEAGW